MTLELDAVLALTEQLLAVSSPFGAEAAIADLVEQRCRAFAPHALTRAGNSLCVVPRALDPRLPTLLLAGHLDTVPALSPNPVRRDGDRLYGLGASDMKAADAVILAAVAQAIARAPARNLVAVLYACEEGPFAQSEMPLIHDAARAWFAASQLVICMEPTDNRIELGALGTCHASVVFGGKRAHSARPWQGDNAIHKAAPLLARLAALPRQTHEFHGLQFHEVMTATGIEFRGARNVVPDRCVVNVNYRFAPGRDEAAVRARLRELVAGEAEFELTDFCPAGKVCGDNPLMRELQTVLAPVEICAKQAWTDVGRLSHLGYDAINWGPGLTAQAHQDGEYASVAEIARCIAALQRWLWPAAA